MSVSQEMEEELRKQEAEMAVRMSAEENRRALGGCLQFLGFVAFIWMVCWFGCREERQLDAALANRTCKVNIGGLLFHKESGTDRMQVSNVTNQTLQVKGIRYGTHGAEITSHITTVPTNSTIIVLAYGEHRSARGYYVLSMDGGELGFYKF